jgi:hypothetical protein
MSEIVSPTISEVFDQFLQDQRQRLLPKTFGKYLDVIELFKHCLDGYASNHLHETERKLFDRHFNKKGDEHRAFTEIFGADHILINVDEFLSWFMVRKVIAGKELMRSTGTVIKKLARWLESNGFADAEMARDAFRRGAAAARDLPQAEQLAHELYEMVDHLPEGSGTEEVEDHFTVTRIQPGKLWLEGLMDARELGPIRVPDTISSHCKVGWTISGILGRKGQRWQFVETWNVYPG